MNKEKLITLNYILLMLVGVLGALFGNFVWQANSIFGNSILGVSTIYLLFFNQNVHEGTLEHLLNQNNKYKASLIAFFATFILAISIRAIAQMIFSIF